MLSPRNRDLLILLALCLLCFLFRLGSPGLFDFNEGFYVEAAREMYLRSDYVTPTVNGALFFDKPPLALWTAATSFRLFGVSVFAARLPVALAAIFTVLLTWLLGRRFFGPRAGLFAGAALALSPLYIGTAHQMTMDVHQTLWFTAAMACFYLGYIRSGRCGWLWYLGFWAACGLSYLSKSVPGLFPIPIVLAFIAIEERFQLRPILRRIWQAQPLLGPLVLAAVVVPWHLLAYRANGRIFYEEYWVLHHVALLHGSDFSHVQPFWYYVPALILGMLPWAFFLPWALRRPPEESEEAGRARRFLTVWAVAVFLIFSAMSSKLLSYLLPMYPAAALLVGAWLDRIAVQPRSKPLMWIVTVSAVFVPLALAALVAVTRSLAHRGRSGDFPPAAAAVVVHGMGLAGVIAIAAALLLWRGKQMQGIACIYGAMAAFVLIALGEGIPVLEDVMTGPLHRLAAEAGSYFGRHTEIAVYTSSPRHPSVFFYMPGEIFLQPLAVKSAHEGILFETGDKDTMEQYLATHRPAVILTDQKRGDELAAITPGVSMLRHEEKWELLYAAPGTGAR